MIDIQRRNAAVLELIPRGTVSKTDIQVALPRVKAALDVPTLVGVLVDLTDLERMTAAALWKDLIEGMRLTSDPGRIARAAVITDRGGIALLGDAEDGSLPGIAIDSFFPDERGEAVRWAGGA